MDLNCAGDYELQRQWLEKHRDAHNLVYDTKSGLPVKAEYINPIYQAYVADPERFFAKVRELMEDQEEEIPPL
jgi:hypothetical protein